MNSSMTTEAEASIITAGTYWTNDTSTLESQIALYLWKVWPPCLLVLGTFGNIATISVMRRIKDNHSSQHIILMALAASDLCLLYASLLRQWLYYLFEVDLYNLHLLVCKLSWWLIYVSSMSSSWLLTCVTVQRTMAVTWPHKMRMVCSTQRTWLVVSAIISFACLFHCHFLFGMEFSGDKCAFRSEEYEDFVTRIWSWVDLSVFSLLPSLCLLVCDVILSLTLFKATSAISVASANTEHISNTRRKAASRTTLMILALSLAFLVLTMPVCVYQIWDYYVFANAAQSTGLWTRTALFFAVAMLLAFTNSSINFLLYCFTGTRFRNEFLNWICCNTVQTPSKS